MEGANEHVRLDIEGDVARVTLARPERRNAFDDGMVAELRHLFLSLGQAPRVKAVVLQGDGGFFSAGADLNWMKRMAAYDFKANVGDAHVLAGMLHALYELPMPTIAVVEGAAFGGAIGLIACCDMAIAAEDTVFALSEVRIGMIPATISPYVIRAIGERASSRLFLTGERFDAQRAYHLGLVSEVVPAPALAEGRDTLLHHILASGPQAVAASKRLLRKVAGEPLDTALIDDTCQAIAEIRVSEEGQAGLNAFLNKQPPPWQSKDQP